MNEKQKNKVKTIYDYIKHEAILNKLRKDNPNNFDFGTKARAYLESLEEGVEYKEPIVKQ